MILPIDIIRYIIEFMEFDIDIRRCFNIYSKIDISRYENLGLGCTNIVYNNFKLYITLPNLYINDNRNVFNIRNDFIEVTIIDNEDSILYFCSIHRLKELNIVNTNLINYNNLINFCWKFYFYNYTRI